ncbi:eCIS core domain-containing protein [Streptomyces syringium]|uniref:eCIS core domain-containing protein n=1 Tax=Streptomyces syringium TaxID=76729 RepID=UPI003452D472
MSRVQVPVGHQQTNEAASQQRKRKARAPKARTPEPKEIITGAGQPLDLGLRRELEERLGHDFSRVRVHTDRDAALLTDLLGADAVTVGEDVFFAEGRFRPGTEDGRRLVAHELLHTVQAPHPLGALKAGRDLGAVSMPQDAVERQAEDGARSQRPRPEVTRNATPGWLRYARVRADQFRTELLDPATLVDRLTAGILRSLRGDPTDAAGRVRQQLVRFAPELKASVLERLSLRLPSSDHERLLELVERSERGPAETDAGVIPGPVTEPTHEPAEQSDVPPKDLPKDPAGEKDEDGEGKGEPKPEDEPKSEDEEKEKEKEKGNGKDKDKKSEEEAKEEPPAKDKESKPGAGEPGPAGTERPQEAPVGAAAGAAVGAEPPRAAAAAQAPGAPEQQRRARQRRPAGGSRPKAVDRRQDRQPGPARPEQVDKLAGAKDSPLARHGLLDDEKGKAEDESLGVEAEAEKDVETPKDEEPEAAEPAGPELRPEDFVPSTDLDVSAVPTADRLDVSAGGPAAQEAFSFPEPPPTKADEIQQDRENEAEEEAEEAPEPPAPQQAAADRPAPAAPEADASARREADREAESRTARDLQPDKPVEQEVGPDPEAGSPEAGRQGPEAEQEAAPEPSSSDGPGRQDVEPAAAEAPPADGRGRSERGARPGPGGPGPSDAAGAPDAMAETEESGPGLGAMGPAAEQAEAPGVLGAPGAQAGPEASLEEGGGACAGAPQPTTEEAGGGEGGCGGGGGGAGGKEKEAEKPAPPDVSGQDPQSALATAGTLPPDQMVPTLDGVDGAVDRSVGEQHAALEADAPTAQRPSGAPRTLSGTPEEAAPAQQVTEHVEREGAEGGKEQKKADGEKVGGQNPAADVSRPNVADDAANQVTAQDVQNMQNAVGEVPTSDPSLNTTVGTAPKVQLTGESDPRRTDKQAENLKTSSAKILGVGREDAAKPMGEDQIYPDVPGETLRGDVPGGVGGAGGRRRAGAAAAAKPGVAVVAQQERGPQIQAAVGQGQGRMGQEQSQQKQAEAEERRASQEAQDQAVAENAEAQAGERGRAAEQVRAERTQWQSEQDEEIGRADTDAAKEHGDKNKEIDTKRTDTDKDVGKRQDEDNQKIQDNRKEAEEKARKEKERKKEESSGWWGWVKSKVKAAFDALLSVVTGIFDFFRKIVNGIIEKFREFANWAIEQARKFAVELIKKLADALIAIGDVLLAAFPELREKFRNKIRQWRDQAIAKVNEWADKLKAAVNKLLDVLAAGLNKLLNLLEKGLKAAVAMVRDAVVAAIDFAQKAIAMLGQFAALVADIAPDPGGWLSKLGTAAKEGIQNHLWGAVKTAVKSWFNEKVESVLGLGKTIINVLVKGCVSMAQIGRMAWQALVQSLPAIIISIVVEKVVSMIVPAAGAIMTIIQGLMAAWGTISKIIAAFGKFFGFLKAVKSGVGAACLFAQAVAAGVVALLEFITNFLLSRLKLAAKGVGGRLKAMAQKIMKGLAKATKGPRKAAGAAVNRAKASLGRAAQALKGPRRPGPRPGPRPTSAKRPTRPELTPSGKAAPARGTPDRTKPSRPSSAGRALNGAKSAVKGALKKVSNAARALGRKVKHSKLGKSLTNGAKKIREAFTRQRDRLRERWNKRKQQRDERRKRENSPQAKERRLAVIVARLRPRLQRLLSKGAGHRIHAAALAGLRLWYRLTGLAVRGSGGFADVASLNPEKLVINGVSLDPETVLKFIREVEQDIRKQAAAREVAQQPRPAKENELPVAEDESIMVASRRNSAPFSRPFQQNVVTYEGAGGGQVGVQRLSAYPKNEGALFARKMNDGAVTGEGGRYSDSEERILRSGKIAETSKALAAFQRSRALDFGADAGEVALLGTLAHDIEPRRNPGTAVLSILQSDFYEQVGREPGTRGQVQRFVRAYRKQTMLPVGSSSAATELKKYLDRKPGALDAAIAKRVSKLRANGVPEDLLNGNLRDLPQWQRQVDLVRAGEKEVAHARQAIAKATKSGDAAAQEHAEEKLKSAKSKLAKRNTPTYRSLATLQKQQDANALANREIALIRSWFNSIGAIDTDSQGNADMTRRLLYDRILNRLRHEFPWWVPSKGLR